ncbi:MAG: type III-B CRISPR module-associated protein Cmr5 [Pseudonocardiaceae bacterium]
MAERVDHKLARAAADVLRDQKVDAELRTRMRGLPALLQTSGLAATCAFLLSRVKEHKPTDAYWRTAKTLLDEAARAIGVDPDPDPRAALDKLTQVTGQQYVLAETRAAMLALWLSRLAQAKAEAQKQDPS